MEELRKRITELEAELKVKDIHISRLAEQLKRERERVDVDQRKPEIPKSDSDREKLVNLVKKLFALLEESERLRIAGLRIKQVDLLQNDLDNLLLNN
jgi:hypothetical protein